MAEDKNKQKPQNIKESVVRPDGRAERKGTGDSIRSSDVTTTLKPPANPNKSGGGKKG